MTNVINYISENYAIILFFIIIIFLAIIGYFAEKANSSQKNKFKEENNKNKDEHTSDEFTHDENKETHKGEKSKEDETIKLENQENKSINLQGELISSVENEENNVIELENLPKIENNDTQVQSGFNDNELPDIFRDEEFNRFSLEFDSLLPKKEIIDTDLLNDIDDLELDKTQKIDLSDVPDLDNIELPKIKQLEEDEDIWKF